MPGTFNGNTLQCNVLSGTPAFEIVGVPGMAAKIREIQFTTGPLTTAQATVFGIGVPAASGSSVRGSRGFQSEDLAPANKWISIVTDWDSPPTSPTTFMRRITLQGTTAANGGQAILKWPKGLTIPSNGSIVVWCITSATKGNYVYANVSVEA